MLVILIQNKYGNLILPRIMGRLTRLTNTESSHVGENGNAKNTSNTYNAQNTDHTKILVIRIQLRKMSLPITLNMLKIQQKRVVLMILSILTIFVMCITHKTQNKNSIHDDEV